MVLDDNAPDEMSYNLTASGKFSVAEYIKWGVDRARRRIGRMWFGIGIYIFVSMGLCRRFFGELFRWTATFNEEASR